MLRDFLVATLLRGIVVIWNVAGPNGPETARRDPSGNKANNHNSGRRQFTFSTRRAVRLLKRAANYSRAPISRCTSLKVFVYRISFSLFVISEIVTTVGAIAKAKTK